MKSSFLQTFFLVSRVWDSWGLALAVMTAVKSHFLTLLSLYPLSQKHPSYSAVCPHFPVFHLLLMYLKKPFLLSLSSIDGFNSKWALAFLFTSLHTLTKFLYSSQLPRSFLHIPYTSFFCLSFTPCRSPDHFAWFLTHRQTMILSLEEVMIKY